MADFELSSGSITAVVSDVGATLKSVRVPDRNGEIAEVTRGGIKYAGAICGRFANRIADGQFSLDGVEHQLSRNEGANHLHGGLLGFDQKSWLARPSAEPDPDRVGVEFTLVSASGDEGFPGELEVSVKYWVNQPNTIGIDFQATTNASTIVNLTNHTYWNLGDENRDDLSEHHLQLAARRYVEVGRDLIPTGRLIEAADSVFDFAEPRPLEHSFDHCFVLNDYGLDVPAVAALTHPASGRTMTIATNQPGLQVYTADHVGRFGVALEAQGFPDAPNHPGFPTSVLRPGEVYERSIVIQFGTVLD